MKVYPRDGGELVRISNKIIEFLHLLSVYINCKIKRGNISYFDRKKTFENGRRNQNGGFVDGK